MSIAKAILLQLTGSDDPSKYQGWPAKEDFTNRAKTVTDYVRALHFELTKNFTVEGISGTLLAHAAWARVHAFQALNEAKATRIELNDRLERIENRLFQEEK